MKLNTQGRYALIALVDLSSRNTKKNAYDLDIVWKKKYGNKFHRFKVQTITIVKLFLKALNFRF